MLLLIYKHMQSKQMMVLALHWKVSGLNSGAYFKDLKLYLPDSESWLCFPGEVWFVVCLQNETMSHEDGEMFTTQCTRQ